MPLIDRRDTILVAIDVQPRFIAKKSMTSEEQVEARATFERALWLAGMATLLDIPSVVVEEGPHRAGKTEPRLMERLPPQTVVHQRKTFGLAAQSEVLAAIKAAGRSTLVLIGFETDTCVAQSAIELCELGFRVVVVEDGIYSTGELEHKRGLRRMRHAGVEINDCKGVAFEWIRVVDDAFEVLRASAAKYGPAPLRL